MIPVTLQAEPADFNAKVRVPGLAYLATKGINPHAPLPRGTKIPSLWSHSNKELWKRYSGVCAYLSIYFEWVTGASSTDHFAAKSKFPGDAYEWNNYRLSSLGPNRNKNNYTDVLDPIGLASGTFKLNLVNGEISPGSGLSRQARSRALKTIKRLKLDSPDHNTMRQRHYNRYLRNKDADTLKELSPFVWYEADRQGLL